MSTTSPTLSSSSSPVYNRMFWLSYTANTALVLANALTFRFAEFVRFLGGTEQMTGTIVGVGVLSAVLVRFRLGQDIDACGTRRLWLTSTALFLAGCTLLLLTTGLSWVLFLARIAFSVGIAGMFTCSMVNIQNQVPAERRTEAIGSLGTSGFLGIIAGSLLGDLVFTVVPAGAIRFHVMFGAAVALGLVYLAIVLKVTRHDVPPRVRRINPPVYRLLTRYWPGSVVLVALVMGSGMVVTTVFLTRMATGLGINGIATFFVGYALTAFIFRVWARNWSHTVGRRAMIAMGLCGHATGHLLLVTVSSGWHFVLPSIACGIGHALLFPAVISLGSGSFPRRFRGTGTTIVLGMTELGAVIFSPLLGWIIDAYGFNAMCWSSSAFTVTLGTIYLVASRRQVDLERDAVARPPKQARPSAPLVAVGNAREAASDSEALSPTPTNDPNIACSA